jgi:hypothetical protein
MSDETYRFVEALGRGKLVDLFYQYQGLARGTQHQVIATLP